MSLKEIYPLDSYVDFPRNRSFEKNDSCFDNLNSKTSFSNLNEEFNKVLIIYMGGSIGMIKTNNGLSYKKGQLEELLKSNSYFHDSSYIFKKEEYSDYIITPQSSYNKRVVYKIEEFEEFLDSSDISHDSYIKLGIIIEENYENYDGFVILQGPPTITYTASMLSFMLENLKKTIIFTGSQLPISLMRNDGYNNLLNSIIIAGYYSIPEVLILFRDKCFRGNRSSIFENNNFNCVSSPNFTPLINLKSEIEVDWEKIIKYKSRKFVVFKNIHKNIGHVKVQPLSFLEVLKSILFNPPEIKALILESYGQGEIPIENEEILYCLKQAVEKGILILNISQCSKYKVTNNTKIGQILEKIGIVNGLDMTPEAAFAKLSYLLGKNLSYNDTKKYLTKNLRGELTPPIKNIFSYREETFLEKMHEALKSSLAENLKGIEKIVLPNIIIHMSKMGYINFLRDLKNNGIVINEIDSKGRNALHLAVSENNIELVKFLIENENFDLNKEDYFGRTCLFEAVLQKNKEIIFFLKEKGANNFGHYNLVRDLLFK